ncbi:MAG: ribbon-helix-helix protein, CopG family [Anaerovoracaceae bacterium]|jgi:hypothetical protein
MDYGNEHKKFDANVYNREYQKKNYKRYGAILTKSDAVKVDEAIAMSGKSKSAFIKEAIFEKIKRENLLKD